jgi:CBS domain containing-hemolysin-like protein
MLNFVWILLAFLLVLLNAFFVAAEFGMVKLRSTRVQAIQKTYGFRGRILAEVHYRLDAYLSACQLGITLASLGLGWIGEPAFVFLLTPLFSIIGLESAELIHIISFVVAFSIISFLHIVVGELMPKSLAIRRSEAVSIWTAVPLYFFYWLMYPAIWVLNSCANLLLRLTRLDAGSHKEQTYSSDEIKFILSASHLHGELTKDETEILEHTLDLADLNVVEVMRPRQDMVALDCAEPIETLFQEMMQNRYSRYPLYEDDPDNIIGIVHVKDLFSALYERKEIKSLKEFMRPVLRVSNRVPAMEVLGKFRQGTSHFALIYSDNNTLIGFVTLDNLLHVLIGLIKDEFHHTQEDWSKLPDGSYSVRGDCTLYSIERALDKDIFSDKEEADTISGLIYSYLDGLPKEGQVIELPEFTVVIEKMRGTRILQVRLRERAE